ncbi:DNA repair protein RecO C-terminal domain-containing protein [Bacteriovorax sp. Seq25_V]|uniref:DNA repair protein RecO C-terminal domain-containing protein n=1 Tax=Bacteriovorax sp. Seq25_V TaxID=1201288 RepID=UPI00038A3B26|nr:DNA repair protein RecO C-terminal domain-containing protein [Bacteriovorax sp. Seq25_V]EQC44709.1 hypothetical protein M900_0441 [Bacteriovorax sp. Seq25_V]
MENIEGVLINKFPYQDKHIVGHLLLRNGLKVSVMFYGGQGGGKNQKGSILQLGYMFKITTSKVKQHFEMLSAKEYNEKWCHANLAGNPLSFYMLCFFCEFIDKFSPQAGSKDDLDLDHEHHGGLFRLLSNAIFFLEKRCKEDKFDQSEALLTFLSKAMVEMGIFPRSEACCVSGEPITGNEEIYLISDNGGFAFSQFLTDEDQRRGDGRVGQALRRNIIKIAHHKYGEVLDLEFASKHMCRILFEYICYQQNAKFTDFKSASLLF